MLTDKREILHIKSYFSKHANEEIILEIIEYCIAIFNSAVGKNFLNMQNLKIEFFNLENGIAVYERFCKQYFPSYLGKYHDDYTQDGYMNSFAAQAFINHDTYGILCSLDTDVDPNSWYETILHEMVHIYCTTHESNGDNFFDKYCVNKKNNFKDGTMGAGYEVWREFIAYYWGAELTPFSTPLSLAQVRAEVRNIDEDVDAKNSVAKMLVSRILAFIFRNPTVRRANNVAIAYEILQKNKIFVSDIRVRSYKSLIETIFEQLLKKDYWRISPYFIDELGAAYIGMLGWRRAEGLRNG